MPADEVLAFELPVTDFDRLECRTSPARDLSPLWRWETKSVNSSLSPVSPLTKCL